MGDNTRSAIKIKRNKLLDRSYNILYTWTAAGDGGIYYRKEHVGGTHPLKRGELVGGTHPLNRKKRRACGRDPPEKKKKLNTTCCVKVIHRHKKAKLILYSYPTISYKGYNLTINKRNTLCNH
jgi:hypothetical protein